MDVFRETIYLEDNPTTGYWEIPIYDTRIEDTATPGFFISDIITVRLVSDKYWILDSATQVYYDIFVTGDNSASSYRRITVVPDDNSNGWRIQIPSSCIFKDNDELGFNQYMNLEVVVFSVTDTNYEDPKVQFIYTLRRAPASSGGSSSAPTADQIAKAVWNYSDDDPGEDMLGERTLSSTVEVDPADIAEAVWNYGNTEETITTRALTADIDLSSITTAIGTLPTASEIANSVLQTDVAQTDVSENGYTLTHLIMASQRSRVRIDGSKHLWEILKGDAAGTVIATRELTLNQNGAIVGTETVSLANQDAAQEETE